MSVCSMPWSPTVPGRPAETDRFRRRFLPFSSRFPAVVPFRFFAAFRPPCLSLFSCSLSFSLPTVSRPPLSATSCVSGLSHGRFFRFFFRFFCCFSVVSPENYVNKCLHIVPPTANSPVKKAAHVSAALHLRFLSAALPHPAFFLGLFRLHSIDSRLMICDFLLSCLSVSVLFRPSFSAGKRRGFFRRRERRFRPGIIKSIISFPHIPILS